MQISYRAKMDFQQKDEACTGSLNMRDANSFVAKINWNSLHLLKLYPINLYKYCPIMAKLININFDKFNDIKAYDLMIINKYIRTHTHKDSIKYHR